MAVWIVLGIIALLVVWAIMAYNGLVSRRNRVDESWSGIDVQLKRRHDLIPNLVETVKGYASHESTVLEAVIKARNSAVDASSPGDVTQAENLLTGTLRQVFALSEAYPNLKADTSFVNLQNELSDTEDKIQASRRIYNGNVRDYNTKIQTFPTMFIARVGNFTEREFFEIENPAEREAVQVSFS